MDGIRSTWNRAAGAFPLVSFFTGIDPTGPRKWYFSSLMEEHVPDTEKYLHTIIARSAHPCSLGSGPSPPLCRTFAGHWQLFSTGHGSSFRRSWQLFSAGHWQPLPPVIGKVIFSFFFFLFGRREGL